jgi:glyceraldehyde-3-phosphate dehydrogenase (NAD(P))
MIEVAVNGYGTIGKRVADAISKQPDMKLLGVVKTKPDFLAKMALQRGYNLYAASPESLENFKKAKIETKGTVNELLPEVDVIIDATPGGTGKQNKTIYAANGSKAIFEGGEKADIAETSFCAQVNYSKAVNKKYVRVVSCNTTGLCRTLGTLDQAYGVESADAVLIRRAADPADTETGPINGILLDPPRIPSHHGPVVQTILPHIKITTMAVSVPTTLMHIHAIHSRIKQPTTKEDIIQTFKKATRIITISPEDRITSTNQAAEYARELGRTRNDLYEVPVWEESIGVNDGRDIYYFQGVHQEANVVPENVDAIRAVTGFNSAEESIQTTNQSLGILH